MPRVLTQMGACCMRLYRFLAVEAGSSVRPELRGLRVTRRRALGTQIPGPLGSQ